MGYVFISYSSKQQKQADFLCDLLKKRNVDYWIATEQIATGQNYAKVIPSAIKQCSCVILLLSNSAQESVYVSNEVDRAINAKKPVFPIKLEGCNLNDEFDFYLCRCQIFNAFDLESDYPSLDAVFSSVEVLTNEGKFLLQLPPSKPLDARQVQNQTEIIEQTLCNNLFPCQFTCKYTGRKFVGRQIVRYYFSTDLALQQLKFLPQTALDLQLKLNLPEKPNFTIDSVDGKNAICVEIVKENPENVNFDQVYDKPTLKHQGKLAFPLGVDFDNKIHFIDVADHDAIFVSGKTGCGKTQVLYNLITSIASATPKEQVKFLIADTKGSTFTAFAKLPHLLDDVICTDATSAIERISRLHNEIEGRFALFKGVGKRNIDEYNAIADNKLPHIIVVIDEIYNLLSVDDGKIIRLLKRLVPHCKSRGIHFIITSQLAKCGKENNLFTDFDAKIVFQTQNYSDSHSLIGGDGALKLNGFGDLYYNDVSNNALTRLQPPYLSFQTIEKYLY